MDQFQYNYLPGTNKLDHVNDVLSFSGNYTVDIDNQNAGNYAYDASGNRLWKKVTPKGTNAVIKTFYYIRDASGNEMSRYVEYTNNSELMYVAEGHNIYGSSRVGMDNSKDTLYKNAIYNPAWHTNNIGIRELGMKSYELSNHLGNVLVTVSDKKVYINNGGTIEFEAEITSVNDYYPFGSPIKSRTFSSGAYRYGFNGMEKDDEINGSGNAYDFGARIYDGRLGRWLSMDPLQQDYPSLSSYQFVANLPIVCIDPDGKKIIVTLSDGSKVEYKPGIQPSNKDAFLTKIHEAVTYAMKADPKGNLWVKLSGNSNTVNIIKTTETGNKMAYETPNIQATVKRDAAGNEIAGTKKITKVESTIKWNPKYGLLTTSGGGQSPSSVLYHEGIHALRTLSVTTVSGALQLAKDRKRDNAKYGALDDKEHSVIIPGEETRYINKVNKYEQSLTDRSNEIKTDLVDYIPQKQTTRSNHRGTPQKASSVNSIPGSASGQAGSRPNISERNNIVLPDNTKVIINPVNNGN